MGATHHSLPLPPKSGRVLFRSPKIEQEKIRVVIPVHNDWQGLKITLDSLQELSPRPGSIIVANDNADNSIPEWLKPYPIEIVNYDGNQGPASARNKGVEHPGPEFDWIYFTDCGCEHARNLLLHFINAQENGDDSIVAICGSVSGKGSGIINRYMTEMAILNPPFENEPDHNGEKIPQAIITANALVYAPAFYQLGGFSADFCEAGGEDLDLGIRLRNFGTLVYEPDAVVSHEFEEDIQDFKRRFERYGKGNRLLEQKYKLPSLRAEPFSIANEEFRGLAKLQTESLRRGYDEAEEDASILDEPCRPPIKIDSLHNTQNQVGEDVESTKWHLPEGAKARLGKGKINEIKYSPDGNQRAEASSIGVWIYDLHTGKELALLTGHTGDVLSIAYSPDSLTLVSGGADGTIRFWDAHTGNHKFILTEHTESVTVLAFSPDGSQLVSGSADGTVSVWDAHTGDRKSTLTEHSGSITALAFSPDGIRFVSGSTNGTIYFWETEIRFGQNPCFSNLMGHSKSVTALAFNRDGSMLASACEGGYTRLWDAASRQRETLRSDEIDTITSVAFSPDSRTLAGGSNSGSIYVYDTITCQRFATLEGHAAAISSVIFSHDGAILISVSIEGVIRLWDTRTGQSKIISSTGHPGSVQSVEFSLDSRTLLSRHGEGIWLEEYTGNSDTLHLWNAETGDLKATFTAHSYHLSSAESSPDGCTLVIWSKSGKLEFWDVETCLSKATFTEKVGEVTSVIFSPDSRMLASWDNNSIIIWDVETGKHKTTFTEDLDNVTSIAFSPMGCTLISRIETKTSLYHSDSTDIIHLWDVETGKSKTFPIESKTFPIEEGRQSVKSVLLSSDNRTLISVSKDKTNAYSANKDDIIHLWDVETRNCKTTFTEEGLGNVKSVLLSSDNRTLISVSEDKTDSYPSYRYDSIRLWDVEAGNLKATLTEEGFGNVESVLLSSDNRTLISVSNNETDRYSSYRDDTIRLWDVETGKGKALSIEEGRQRIKSVLLSSDNCTLASWCEDGTTHLWDVETGKRKATITEGRANVKSVAFSSDNHTLISVIGSNRLHGYSDRDSDDIIHLWDVETGKRKGPSAERLDNVKSVILSSDSRTLICVSGDETNSHSANKDDIIHLWDVETGKRKATITEGLHDVKSVILSSDNRTLISVSSLTRDESSRAYRDSDDIVHLWDVETGKRKIDPTGNITDIALSPDGSILASGNDVGTILLWEVPK